MDFVDTHVMHDHNTDECLSEPWCPNWREALFAWFRGETFTNYGGVILYGVRPPKDRAFKILDDENDGSSIQNSDVFND